MSEEKPVLFEPLFNRAVKVRSRDQRISSDAGALLLREVDHRLGLVESLASELQDPRDPDKIRYQQSELLRERIYALAHGYDAADDLDLLAHDPVMKAAVWDRPGDQVLEERLGSQPTNSRLLSVLAWKHNLEALRRADRTPALRTRPEPRHRLRATRPSARSAPHRRVRARSVRLRPARRRAPRVRLRQRISSPLQAPYRMLRRSRSQPCRRVCPLLDSFVVFECVRPTPRGGEIARREAFDYTGARSAGAWPGADVTSARWRTGKEQHTIAPRAAASRACVVFPGSWCSRGWSGRPAVSCCCAG